LVWAIAVGYLVFGAVPAPTTLAGAAVIAGAGLYTLHRARLKSRAQT
jgi:drug/metabolite transporter (DMT)-like permease